MASISSLMGSSSSTGSIYGSRNSNIISGLASGLDTEAMIEGMVQGYQQKIAKLQQENTKLQWEQEAYQSISNKLVEFARKYTSYSSPATNLFSNSFFDNAVVTSTSGTFANLVSATGKTSSEVILNAVTALATAASKSFSGTGVDQSISYDNADKPTRVTATGGKVDLSDTTTVSTVTGSMTLSYGGTDITLNFDELDLFSETGTTLNADGFKNAIQKKLEAQDVVVDGTTHKASDLIEVSVDGSGKVTLTDVKNAGNSPAITGVTGDLQNVFTNADTAVENGEAFQLDSSATVVKDKSKAEYLSEQSFSVTLNGQTKTITLGELSSYDNASVQSALQTALDDAFGKNTITVGLTDGRFSFTTDYGDLFSISSAAAGETLFGEGTEGVSSYVNTNKTLEQLMGNKLDGLNVAQGAGGVTQQPDGSYVDSDGNRVDANNNLLDANGNQMYALTINGETIGNYSKDTSLQTILDDINGNTEAGVNVSYSQLTNQFVLTAKETGKSGTISFGETNSDGSSNLAAALFGGTADEAGTDATINATINGQKMTLTRSSNTFDIDGMSVTVSGTFDPPQTGETAVTFTSKSDTDAIVDVVKQMVEDYNAILTEVKKAYSDQPLKQTNGDRYEPLTEEDRADMTESEIKAYEEKAKTGLLFMDSDLSSLYNALRSAITPGGSDGSLLRSIGINTSYSDGLTTISLDENALREALESNPDQVRDAFTKRQDNGSATDGLMASIQKVTDRYAATSGATKGILIEKAGSQYSPSAALDNTLLKQMNEVEEEIQKWQDKMADRVDYYTNKFTQLEVLIQQMNSQSSSLAGLMGGY